MEKKRVKNRRENGWEGCLDERGRGREKWWGPAIFSLGPPQLNLSKMGRKWGREEGRCAGQSCPPPSHGQLFVFFYCFCLSVVFFFFFLASIKSFRVCTVRSHWFWFWFFFFFLDKILHSKPWFFLFVFISFFFF